MPAPMPADEGERLLRLRELLVLDSEPEAVFDELARLASEVCGVPIALLSLIDAERQWFKANVGLPGVNETPREHAFCAHAILEDSLFEVADATLDPRFAGNPLVTGAPDIRFYAGAPLVLPDGERVGTLCVIGRQTGRLDAGQARMLRSLARIATQALMMRRDLITRSLSVRSEYEQALGRDIAERKRTEEALRASQAFLARTGHVSGVGGWEVDLASGAINWSEQTRRIHEVGPDHVPTLPGAFDFYAPEARPALRAAVEAGMRGGPAWDMELPFVTAAGRRRWVRVVGEAEFDGGQPTRLVGAIQDITERKALEQRLADNERFLRQITDSLPLRIAYVDREKRYRFVNLAHCERFGLPREQIIGRTRSELTQGSSDAVVGPRLDAALAGQRQRFEFEEPSGDGGMRRIESQLVPDVGEAGEVRGVYTTGIDITERSRTERALRELTAIFDNTTDYVVQTDWRGDITYLNPAVRRALGLPADAPIGRRNFAEFNTPQTQRHFVETILPAAKANGVWLGETTVYVAGARELPVSHMVIAHRDETGRVGRYSAVIRDISKEVAAKNALERQTATLRSVTEAVPAIIAVVGTDARYRFVNSAFERWCGARRESIVGRTLQEVLGRTDYERSRPWVEQALAGETVSFERDYRGRGTATHLALSYIPLRLEDGSVDGFVGVAQDISSHRQEEVRLLQLTQRDALTGLLNRAGFEAVLERRLQEGSGELLALLYIDLDHFKPVNDRHGHPVGDQLLQQFAQRLTRIVRPTDAVARLGGDEFAVVLVGVRESAHAQGVADKVVEAARQPFEVGALQLTVGASVGVAFRADPATGWRDLVARADAMLYRAKEGGRGRHSGASRF